MARGNSNYIPRPDGDFSAWVNQYYDVMDVWWNTRGLDPADLNPLKDAVQVWNAAYPAHIAARAAAEGARAAKDAARAALEKEVRPITNFVQGYPDTTNADRAEIGITVRDTARSAVPPPTSAPVVRVESGQRLMHRLRLVDESTPTRRARPKGVLGAEVWVKLVAPPTADAPAGSTPGASPGDPARDPSSFTFLTMTTKPSFRAEFKAGEGGKAAVYMARWVNTLGGVAKMAVIGRHDGDGGGLGSSSHSRG